MPDDKGHRDTIFLIGAAVIGIVVLDKAFNGDAPTNTPRPAPSVTASPAGPSNALLLIRAQRQVKSLLRDPDSARFSGMTVYRAPAEVVCGYVTSRNGFGGMSGEQRFISGSVTAIEEQMKPGEMDKLWPKACR